MDNVAGTVSVAGLVVDDGGGGVGARLMVATLLTGGGLGKLGVLVVVVAGFVRLAVVS